MKRKKLNILSVLGLFLISNTGMSQNIEHPLASSTRTPLSIQAQLSPLFTNIGSDQFGSEEKGGFGFNGGVSVLYEFYRKEKLGLHVSLGLGVSRYANSRETTIANSLWTTDADDERVQLTENADNFKEHQRMLFLDIPVRVGADYSLSSKLEAYATLGLSYGFNMKATYDATAVLTRTGYYPATNALLYDVNLPGSPYFYPDKLNVSGSDKLNKKNNVTGEIALGLKYALNPTLKLFGGLTYAAGLSNVHGKTSQGSWILASDAVSLSSLSNRNDALHTSGFGLEVGVLVNLPKKVGRNKNSIEQNLTPIESKQSTTVLRNTETVSKEKQPEFPTVVQMKTPEASKAALPLSDNSASTNKTAIPDTKIQGVLLIANVLGEDKDNASKTTVLVKEDSRLITQTIPDKDGYIKVDVPEGKVYNLEVLLKGYLPKYQTVDLTNVSKGVEKTVEITPIQKINKGLVFEYESVNFKNGTVLSAESYGILDNLAAVLKDYSNLSIIISGHTDNVGNPAFNLTLSKKRAFAIKKYLLSKGLLSNQIKTIGYGQTRPIASNRTTEGRYKNRRVEFRIVNF